MSLVDEKQYLPGARVCDCLGSNPGTNAEDRVVVVRLFRWHAAGQWLPQPKSRGRSLSIYFGGRGRGKGNGILGKVELPSESAVEAVAESQFPLKLKLKLPSSSGLG